MTAILALVQVALGLAGLGSVPLPTGLNVTILSVPASLAGALAGSVPGAFVGGVFGATSFALATTPLFQNPLIAIVPRLLIGPIAALVYRLARPLSDLVAFALAGAFGAAANTGLVLALATAVTGPSGAPYISPEAALDVARTNIPSEALVAALFTAALGLVARIAKIAPDP